MERVQIEISAVSGRERKIEAFKEAFFFRDRLDMMNLCAKISRKISLSHTDRRVRVRNCAQKKVADKKMNLCAIQRKRIVSIAYGPVRISDATFCSAAGGRTKKPLKQGGK